jgi:histone deacetylase complex regulatory component SIN3
VLVDKCSPFSITADRTDVPSVLNGVAMIMAGKPGLVEGFQRFLPLNSGYNIADDLDKKVITITTPKGLSVTWSYAYRDREVDAISQAFTGVALGEPPRLQKDSSSAGPDSS